MVVIEDLCGTLWVRTGYHSVSHVSFMDYTPTFASTFCSCLVQLFNAAGLHTSILYMFEFGDVH